MDLHVTLQLTDFIADEDEVLMHAGPKFDD